jgi:DNA end-binding protein Ku
MAARAIWKGVVHVDDVKVPVKLYSALEDTSVRFRLLERSTHEPIVQALVHPDTDEVVPYEATRRGFVTDEDEIVVLEPEDLAQLEPPPSRDIQVERFVPEAAIDHRLYARPYYLGPDGDGAPYMALARALQRSGRAGVAHWVMRKKSYVGALRLHDGYPMLVTLRSPDEVVPVEQVERPAGKALDARQLAMARQLVAMLEAPFEHESFRDEYRDRVLDLIEAKRRGDVRPPRRAPRRRPTQDLEHALAASLRAARPRAGRRGDTGRRPAPAGRGGERG